MFIVFYDNKNFYLNLTFENKFIIYIGLISFSLYLWHLPIIAIFNDLLNFSLDKKIIILVLLLSFFIASLSHRYVELPFRNINFLSQKNIFKLFFIAIFLFVLFGLFGHLSDGFEKKKIKNLYILLRHPLKMKFSAYFFVSFLNLFYRNWGNEYDILTGKTSQHV